MQGQSLHQIITEHPFVSNIFEKYQLDFCCQGKQTLSEACQRGNIPVQDVVTEIEKCIQTQQQSKEAEMDTVSNLSIPQLIEHIISTHHQFLRQHVPSAQQYLDKVARVHGDRHPELKQLHTVATQEFKDILAHIQEEEDTIFKILAKDATSWSLEDKKQIKEAILGLEKEHQEQGAALSAMRKSVGVTSSYEQSVPQDGCKSYHVLFHKLDQFEQDTHLHVHKENYILFPKVQQILSNQ